MYSFQLNEESGDDPIQITGVEADVMDLILTFLYTGEIVMNQDNVYNVMAAAHDLDLRSELNAKKTKKRSVFSR